MNETFSRSLVARMFAFGLMLASAALPLLAEAADARSRVLIQRGNVEIDVIVDGDGDPLVLLPSSQRGSEDFDEVAERIAAAGFRVLRPQPRGIGRSKGPMDQLTLHDLASDVATTIRTLGQGKAVIVGHAYGHYVARVADLDYPGLVRGVVVAAAAARGPFEPSLPASLDFAANGRNPEAERIAHLRRAFFAEGNDPRGWLDGWYPELAPIYRKAGRTPPNSKWWPVANAPILDLQAADDPWRPRTTAMELKDVLKDKVTVEVIPNASHALFPEQPKAVAEAIVKWAKVLPR